jgi:hypothetical protein
MVTTAAADGTFVRRSGSRTLDLRGFEARAGVTLPDRFVVGGTDSVFVDGSCLARGADYVIDYDASVVSILLSVPDTASVTISYLFLPLDIGAGVFRHAVLESLASTPAPFHVDAELVDVRPGRRDAPTSGLRVGGAKTFGITVGSDRDPSLEQSLRLNISGRVTRDVAVNAYLSDQNTPLVPEGDTEELRALDKVLVEIEGEGVSATMGDYELVVEGGSLSNFRRDLSGATVTADVGRAGILLAGARSSGEFASHTFRGVDGRQGPYLLVDRSGSPGVRIVAGSERVWLDGVRLRRGRDNDYVIDYAAGEIEFTEHMPVSGDREIAVDYEYLLSDYERDIYGGRATAASAGGNASLGFSFFREADDRNASASTVLTEEEIAVLASAGDDVELAHDDGVDSVGFGNGDYEYDFDAGHYVYAGVDLGDYALSFERADGGDYKYDFDAGHYVYAGVDSGDYRLGKSLPLPGDRSLAALDARLDLADGGFITAEAAVSSFDANTFSELDDDDNLGSAEFVSAEFPRIELGADGVSSVGVGVRARRVAGNFEAVGRYRDVRYVEKWELLGLELPDEEIMVEGSGKAEFGGGGGLQVSQGYLSRGDVLESRKTEFSLNASPWGGSRVWAEGRRVDLEHDLGPRRERLVYAAGAEQALGPVRPGISYRHDARTAGDSDGERYDEYAGSVASTGQGALTFGVRYAQRFTERADGGPWQPSAITRTQDYRVGVSGSDRLSLEASLTRRVTEFEEGFEDPDSKYDIAALRANHRSLGGALSGEVRYAVTSTEIEERQKHVTVEDGVEITRIVSTGAFYPVTDLTASTRWKLEFRQAARAARGLPDPSALRRFLSALTLETDVKLGETTTTGDKRRLYLLDPSVLRGEDTVRGEVFGRHVARYVPQGGSYSARVTVTTRDALDRRYTNSSERRRERAGVVDLKLSRGRGTTYAVQGDLRRRQQTADGAGDDYDISERAGLFEIARRGPGDLESKISVSVRREEEALAEVELTELAVTPSITYRFRGRGTATASLSRIEIDTKKESLPVYLAGGRRPGITSEWRVSGDLRFNRYLTGSLTYTGERALGSETRHTVDVRVNAFF